MRISSRPFFPLMHSTPYRCRSARDAPASSVFPDRLPASARLRADSVSAGLRTDRGSAGQKQGCGESPPRDCAGTSAARASERVKAPNTGSIPGACALATKFDGDDPAATRCRKGSGRSPARSPSALNSRLARRVLPAIVFGGLVDGEKVCGSEGSWAAVGCRRVIFERFRTVSRVSAGWRLESTPEVRSCVRAGRPLGAGRRPASGRSCRPDCGRA